MVDNPSQDIKEEIAKLLKKKESDFVVQDLNNVEDLDEVADTIFDALYEHVHALEVDYE